MRPLCAASPCRGVVVHPWSPGIAARTGAFAVGVCRGDLFPAASSLTQGGRLEHQPRPIAETSRPHDHPRACTRPLRRNPPCARGRSAIGRQPVPTMPCVPVSCACSPNLGSTRERAAASARQALTTAMSDARRQAGRLRRHPVPSRLGGVFHVPTRQPHRMLPRHDFACHPRASPCRTRISPRLVSEMSHPANLFASHTFVRTNPYISCYDPSKGT